jgi:hypothetical protein
VLVGARLTDGLVDFVKENRKQRGRELDPPRVRGSQKANQHIFIASLKQENALGLD